MNLWFWLRKGEIRNNFEKANGARTEESFGTKYRFQPVAPDRSESFTGRGFTWSEVEALIVVASTPLKSGTNDGLLTITDHMGNQWKGAVASLSWEPVGEGGTVYWSLSLTLDEPVKL